MMRDPQQNQNGVVQDEDAERTADCIVQKLLSNYLDIVMGDERDKRLFEGRWRCHIKEVQRVVDLVNVAKRGQLLSTRREVFSGQAIVDNLLRVYSEYLVSSPIGRDPRVSAQMEQEVCAQRRSVVNLVVAALKVRCQ